MCYSAEVSLGTFLFVTGICCYLWYRNHKIDRALALFMFVIGFMQFLEYIIWMNLECNETNKLVSKILPVYLFFQPILLNLIIWQMKAGNGTLYPYIVILGTLFGTLYFSFFYNTKGTCVKKGECNHLNWNIKNNLDDRTNSILDLIGIPFYYFALFYAAGTLKNTTIATTFVATWGISWVITNTLYKEVWSSVWCHAANASALFALLL